MNVHVDIYEFTLIVSIIMSRQQREKKRKILVNELFVVHYERLSFEHLSLSFKRLMIN